MRSSYMLGSYPWIAARHLGPALGRHQLHPALIELPMIALAHAEIAGPGIEVLIEALMSEPHPLHDRRGCIPASCPYPSLGEASADPSSSFIRLDLAPYPPPLTRTHHRLMLWFADCSQTSRCDLALVIWH